MGLNHRLGWGAGKGEMEEMKRGQSTAPAPKDAGRSSAHTENGLLYLPSESQDGA